MKYLSFFLSVSLHDTTDDSLGLEIPLEEPVLNSWVGVKVNKVCITSKGRNTNPFEVYMARVSPTTGSWIMNFLERVMFCIMWFKWVGLFYCQIWKWDTVACSTSFILEQVAEYDAERYTVSYLKEKDKGYYVYPVIEETSLIMPKEILVLQPPKPISECRTYGFRFTYDIACVLRDYFSFKINH